MLVYAGRAATSFLCTASGWQSSGESVQAICRFENDEDDAPLCKITATNVGSSSKTREWTQNQIRWLLVHFKAPALLMRAPMMRKARSLLWEILEWRSLAISISLQTQCHGTHCGMETLEVWPWEKGKVRWSTHPIIQSSLLSSRKCKIRWILWMIQENFKKWNQITVGDCLTFPVKLQWFQVFTQRQCEISKDIVDNYRTMFESRISAGGVEKLPFPQNLRISSWSNDMEGHAKKCVERYCELANRTTQQLYKVSTPCIDDHHFKDEETKSVGELSNVCSQIVLKCLNLARIGRPEIKNTCLRNSRPYWNCTTWRFIRRK